MKTPNELVLDCLERVRVRIWQNIDTTGTKASGKTQESMWIESTPTGGRLWGRPYFQSVETGRPAGRVPFNFVAIIKQWIIDKGISVKQVAYKTSRQHKYSVQERSLNMAAGAIAHSIETTGTQLFKSGGRHDIYSDVIAEEVAQLRKDLAVSVAETLSQTLSEGYKSHAIGDATFQHLN